MFIWVPYTLTIMPETGSQNEAKDWRFIMKERLSDATIELANITRIDPNIGKSDTVISTREGMGQNSIQKGTGFDAQCPQSSCRHH